MAPPKFEMFQKFLECLRYQVLRQFVRQLVCKSVYSRYEVLLVANLSYT